MDSRRSRTAVGILLTGATGAHLLVGLTSEPAWPTAAGALVYGFAVLSLLRFGRRWHWKLIGFGLANEALGLLLGYPWRQTGSVVQVAAASVQYLIGAALLAVGIGALALRGVSRLTVGARLDAVAAALACGAVTALFVDIPGLVTAVGSASAVALPGMVRVALNVVLLSVVVGMGAATGWRIGLDHLLLAAGLSCLTSGDLSQLAVLGTATPQPSRPAVVLFGLGVALIGAAALASAAHPRPHTIVATPSASLRSGFPPLASAALATVLMAVAAVLGTRPLAVTLAAVSVLAALARSATGFRALLTNDHLRELARTDDLTGLVNRRGFTEHLHQALSGGRFALFMLDLDRFKEVNDTLGHLIGDDLLRAVGRRLATATATAHTEAVLGRLGGDEFGVILPGASVGSAMALADRIQAVLAEDVGAGGHRLRVTASIGVALHQSVRPAVQGNGIARDDHEVDHRTADPRAIELLRQADIAMYQAKHQRTGVELYDVLSVPASRVTARGRARVWSARLGQGGSGNNRPGEHANGGNPVAGAAGAAGFAADQAVDLAADLAGDLADAIRTHRLTLVYQPQLDIGRGLVQRVEALVRWPHPVRGLLAPDVFVPLAERTGLMRSMTEEVLRMAADQAAVWQADGGALSIAVNLSGSDVARHDLPDQVMALLAERRLAPDTLAVEVTESTAVADLGSGVATLARLRQYGVDVAIDDFGTGYSALSYLQLLPADELKLDRGLISRIIDDPGAAAITRACIDLAHDLGLRVVAEGVEDEHCLDALRAWGADLAQGYYIGRPSPPGELALPGSDAFAPSRRPWPTATP